MARNEEDLNVDALHPADRLESLDREDCLKRLEAGQIGRFGFVVDGQPRIVLVNYGFIDGNVVVVSRPGAKLLAAVHEQSVAFEIDSVEEWAQAGWSVLVLGVASVISDPAEATRLAAQSPQAWAPTAESRLIRISPSDVTGRRVRVDPGGVSEVRQEINGAPEA